MKYIVSGVVPQPMHRPNRTQFDHHPSTVRKTHSMEYPVGEANRHIEVVCSNKRTAAIMESIFGRLFVKVECHVHRP